MDAMNPSDLRIAMPGTYDVNRGQLTQLLAQAKIYIVFNKNKFKSEVEQVLWISTLY